MIERVNSKIFSDVLWCGIGGHFEDGELNSPKECIIRELFEETSIKENDIENLTLKYITIRKKGAEIRQQYIYFADLANLDVILRECDEGELRWIKLSDIQNLRMSITNAHALSHYFKTGSKDDYIYTGVVTVNNNTTPNVTFTALRDFDTDY